MVAARRTRGAVFGRNRARAGASPDYARARPVVRPVVRVVVVREAPRFTEAA